ncbi:MAG: valine--tRNA ligase [Gammaproteobacteria bacterium]|nr:valine--tRNA ligase [Gammaproteobacteria bacterium]MYK48174.1 valine--tRNA ligase [Gammaproteobacteria bacterium]
MKGSFDPATIEAGLYEAWEREGHFAPRGNGAPYCIVIPPPNITDRLHIGHAFQHTLMDALMRYHRMNGRRALWQTGTDHAQIATQMVVERQLLEKGIKLEDIGRQGFIDKVWDWKRTTGGNISRQIRRMGSSVDWSRERFTMDEGFSKAVIEVFVRLYDEGLLYRGKRLVNWDPVLMTSISDLEVDNNEEAGHLWHFRYPLADGARTSDGLDHLVVATTRPETMLGDTAVAVHTDDERYRSLVGKSVLLPLAGRRIPVIADDHVDPEFGSGCVKITPAHDFDDNAIGTRHGLEMVNIFEADATINDNAPPSYRGLDRFEARQRVVDDMRSAGLLARVEEHSMTIPRGDRSEAIIEPWLTDQWFVKIKPLAEPAIKAVEDGDVEFVPKQYENMYFSWMRELEDWCISRQQWWGHQIPAWYDESGNIHVGRTEAEARSRAGLGDDVPLRQDGDVLDTWFSSALWTFGTLGWPERTPELATYHPTDVLVTGYDIIFFWVARMVMMTLKFTGEVPFKKVHIHGMVRDAEGAKMSKTRGNGLDPMDIIDGITTDGLVAKRTANMTQPRMAEAIEARTRREYPNGIPAYGTDALRFAFCAMASQGRDLAFDLKRIEGYRNFCNKLWNATRFVLGHVEDPAELDGPVRETPADRWIRSKSRHLIDTAHRSIANYRFDLYANAVYEFAWHEYCDWYVELTKPVLFDAANQPKAARAAKRTLLEVLELLLRAAHPIVPFITETLWLRIAPLLGSPGNTIMHQPFPRADEQPKDVDAEDTVEWLKAVVTAVRNVRGELNVPPRRTIDLLLQAGGAEDRRRLDECESLLCRLARVEAVRWLDDNAKPPPVAVQVIASGNADEPSSTALKAMVPMADLIDADAERARLNKAIDTAEKDLRRVEGKLANENFVAKAPTAVVAKERNKHDRLLGELGALKDQLSRLDGQ